LGTEKEICLSFNERFQLACFSVFERERKKSKFEMHKALLKDDFIRILKK